MKNIKLNGRNIKLNYVNRYALDPKEKYIINIKEELEFQKAILMAFRIIGPPPAIKNYHAWLHKNGFDVEFPNPTNEFVAPYYGIKPLWRTDYSQGIVIKAENDDDYYIVMECSGRNQGYRHTQVILTMTGCL